ncbi:amino acid/amide ABC transporter substrate-binding protein, HAAT family [Faunimonas pinastri]|uniref:Amino acid/amide ABC transporter substrate-binding protein, HAAT family n=1 Tax=Faunimonas pinastri TaxID=1855383 RepID=A0A1H9ED16_9HYPH|nr:ABC transporter substrate-binding protein [Faunimonas pinastri]SEQ23656.1 amino acid/amide ABC transporter substrate-binding protein, HAAT family [Faunimonas pinastri]
MKRLLATAAIAALLAGGSTVQAEELVLGEIHPITGPASFYGLVMSQTLKMNAEQANAAGGIDIGGKKYQISIDTGDDQAQATKGVAAFRKLLADNVHFVIGPLASAVAPAIKPVIDARPDVLQIIDGSIADGVVNGKNSFRVQADADTYNDAAIDYLKSKGIKSSAILTDRGHQGFRMSEQRMMKSLKNAGVNIAAQEYFQMGDTDFSAQITKLAASQSEALILRGYPGEGALITKQAQQLGYKGQIVWEMGAPPSTVMKNIPATQMDGVVNCIPRMMADYIRLNVPNAIKVADAFHARYGKDAGENAAFSNDAFWILTTAMQKAGGVEPGKVAAVLKDLKVTDVPNLIIQYKPQENGLLFKNGQAHPPSACQIWHGENWASLPGDHLDLTTKN